MMNSEEAVERYFRLYYRHCTEPNEDSLFNLLEALHSLKDRLGTAGGARMTTIDEFRALRELRNYFHHQSHVKHKIAVLPAAAVSFTTDLPVMCLAPLRSVEEAFKRFKSEEDAECARAVLVIYGDVADINPCIFNCSVKVFELLRKLGIHSTGPHYEEMRSSYEHEEALGLSHYVEGRPRTLAGDVKRLRQAVAHMLDL